MTQAQLQPQEAAQHGAELTTDVEALMKLVWDHQEVKRLGWISINQLQEASGMLWPRFRLALDGLLERPCIYFTKSGGLGYTW